jgi:hypothetical protein
LKLGFQGFGLDRGGRIIEDLIGKFKVFLPGRVFDTPTLTRYFVERGVEEPLEEGKQALFRSRVGSLLYLVKHSRPDIANCVRELSKVMDRAGYNHWKALLRAIRYCEVTKDHVIHIFNTEKQKRVTLEVFCDSDYAMDKETRRIVTGYVIFMDGSPISWRSKEHRDVTLSTTEAEYAALSEATREVKFVHQVLVIMGVEVDLPIRVNVFKIGAIFLFTNRTESDRTKHIDTRYHFVRDLIESNFINMFFMISELNVSNIFTKNLDSARFTELQKRLMVHPRHTKRRVLKTEEEIDFSLRKG